MTTLTGWSAPPAEAAPGPRSGAASGADPRSALPSSAFRPSGLRVKGQLALLPRALTTEMRPRMEALVQAMASQIQVGVGRYAGPRSGRRRRLIEAGVSGAVRSFVDALEGHHGRRDQVDDLFRRMGRAEALDGNDLEAMRAALEIATRDAWRELHDFAIHAGLSAAALGQLGDALFALMDRLSDQVSAGFRAACDEIGLATQSARSDLLTALLEHRPHRELEELAAAASWPLPERYVVLVASTTGEDGDDELVLLDPGLLLRLAAPVSVGVVPVRGIDDEAALATAIEELGDLTGVGPICVGWQVARDELAEAVRWGRRTLDLVGEGVVPAADVVRCADHTTTLWLQSEPLLRRKLATDLLAPLLRETPHSRDVLSHTLLAWLATHDSAPVLARRLGVHAQTVRYRLRRLRELLGDRLDDADAGLAMRLALEASLPLWAAGHQAADIELVRL